MSAFAAAILKASVEVTDAAGHKAMKPIPVDGANAIALVCEKTGAPSMCAAVYLVQAFRESGYGLFARGDCLDHKWDSADETYKKTHPRLYEPDAHGKCREGDGEPLSYGPFQMRRAPATWAQAVADFTPALQKSFVECAGDPKKGIPPAPLAMVASGSCTNKAGIAISNARMAEARRVSAFIPYVKEGSGT